MDQPKKSGISRRQFARRAALLSATASIAPAASVFADALPAPAQQPPDTHPQLSAESQTEAGARYQQILSQYGSRFSAEENTTIRQTNLTMQTSLDKIRAYPLE